MDNNSPNSIKDIVDQDRIIQLLEIAKRHVANLRLRIDDSATTYFSSIIDIDLKENAMSLELLRPDSGNVLLHNSGQVDIEVFLNNSKLNWSSQVFKDDYTCMPDYFKVDIPTHMLYTQQRRAYRIQPQDTIEVVLSHPEFGPIHGELVNLSVDGVAAKIPEDYLQEINPGTFYQDCLMHLPERDVLCAIEVRHRDNETAMFGARFCSLSKLQQHAVAQLIAETDRVSQRNNYLGQVN